MQKPVSGDDDKGIHQSDAAKDSDKPKNGYDTGYQPRIALALTVGIFIFAQIIVAIGIGFIAYFTGHDPVEFTDTITDSNTNLFLLALALSFLQFLGIYFALFFKRKKLRSIGLVTPVRADIGRAVAYWLIYLGLFVFAVLLLDQTDLGVDLEQEQQLDFSKPTERPELALIFAAIVLLPAFIEEFLMRGFLFHSLRSKLSFWPSTLVVSVVFGAAHFQIGSGEPLLWVAFVDTFILSMVLCHVTERFRTLWPAIIIHALKNSIAYYFIFIHVG